MVLVPMQEMLRRAGDEKYGIGLFVVPDLEFVEPIIEAAEDERSPVILGAASTAEHRRFDLFLATLKPVAEKSKVPVGVHLDHGRTMEQVVKCIRNGWTSVMFDASTMPLDENIRLTQEVVKMCHAAGIVVEAELGEIPVVKEQIVTDIPEDFLTNPEEVKGFVEKTGIDMLAVSVGQVHHFPRLVGDVHTVKRFAKIDFDRLERIREKTDVALCMHGCSHVPYESLKRAIEFGVAKMNIGTVLMTAWTDALRKALKGGADEIWPTKVLEPAELEVKRLTSELVGVLGSSGKAW